MLSHPCMQFRLKVFTLRSCLDVSPALLSHAKFLFTALAESEISPSCSLCYNLASGKGFVLHIHA